MSVRTQWWGLCLLMVGACDKPSPAPPPAPADAAPTTPATPAAAATQRPQDGAVAAAVGHAAPDFVLTDLEGKTHQLSAHRGKLVVLEWFNPLCPFVKYAHTEGPLVSMAAEQVGKGVVWLAINSGGEGHQGFAPEANVEAATAFGMKHPILRDPDGVVGRLYGAEKTPHMFVIDEAGTLVYAGGTDNAPFGEVDGDAPKRPYVAEALASVRASKLVATPTAPPWGCTVKYASAG